MRLTVAIITLLLALLVVSAPALAQAPGYAKADMFHACVSGFTGDTLVFECELSVVDGSTGISSTLLGGIPGKAERLGSLVAVAPAHTPPAQLAQDLAVTIGAHDVPWLRSANVHGVTFWYYAPGVDWVCIKLYGTAAYDTSERYLATVTIDP